MVRRRLSLFSWRCHTSSWPWNGEKSQVRWFSLVITSSTFLLYCSICSARRPLRVLVMAAITCAQFDPVQIWTRVNAIFSLFGHQTQVDATWSQYCFPQYRRACTAHRIVIVVVVFIFFLQLASNLRLLASSCGHPSQVCLCKFAFPYCGRRCTGARAWPHWIVVVFCNSDLRRICVYLPVRVPAHRKSVSASPHFHTCVYLRLRLAGALWINFAHG